MEKEPTIEELKSFLGEYLRLKGINTSSVFRCVSPNHEDKHPSMSFYKKGNICNCFACGEKYNIFRLVGMEYGLKGFKEQKEKVIELYRNRELIEDANTTIYSKKNVEVELNTNSQQKEIKEKKYPELDYYYLECKKRINETDYLQKRGISKEVQNKYNIGYDPNFKNGTWKALIIPTTHYSFTARNTDMNSEDRLRKIGKSEIFNYWELEQNKKEAFYIVEGEIDALSIVEAGKKAIALGSVNNTNLFINKLKNDLPGNKFYLMLDNDEQGIKAQEELYNKMKELNLDVENTKVLDKYKDPNEFLVADRDNFMKALNELERNIPISSESKNINIENNKKKVKNLYEYFNCSSKEELYQLVKNRDPSVKELLNYFKYAIKENDISENKIKLVTSKQIAEYLEKGNLPDKENISILILDSELQILKDIQVHKDTPFPEVFKEFYSPKAVSYVTTSVKENEFEKGKIRYKLDTLGYLCMSNFDIHSNKNLQNIVFEDVRNGIVEDTIKINTILSSLKPRKEKIINYELENTNDLVKMEGFDEFTKYISEKELVGLNVIKDENKIKQLLKIGNQELSYENFKIIKYDKGYNISEIVTLGQGGVNYAKVDPKHIYPHLLDEKLKGIILCHNHPSGAVAPSREDNLLTDAISKRASFFNKEVLDHLIVGKEGVYKYSENDLIFMEEVKKAKEYLETHKTYNCLTGEPINIQNHSSGENKWIGKKDVEKYGIEKVDGAKETIGKIAYIENNKLYEKPVPYYNLTELKITKEIEQKFVPMKEKEKTQEISKSKGQGIGD